jgi:hypothetical protein
MASFLEQYYGAPVATLPAFVTTDSIGWLYRSGVIVRADPTYKQNGVSSLGVYDLGICTGQPNKGTYIPFIGRATETTVKVGRAPDLTATRITEETLDFRGNERVLINIDLKLLYPIQREGGVRAEVETEWISPSGPINRPMQSQKLERGETTVSIAVVIHPPRPRAGESTVTVRVNRVELAKVKFNSTPVGN